MDVVLVSWTKVAPAARSSARHADAVGAHVVVLDLDGSYRPVAGETVHRPADLGIDEPQLRRRVLLDGIEPVARSVQPALARRLGGVVLVAAPGVLLTRSPDVLASGAAEHGLALVARHPGPVPPDGRHPDGADLLSSGTWHTSLIAVDTRASDVLERWETAAGTGGRWLDVIASAHPHAAVRDAAVLVSASTLGPGHRLDDDPLTLDGRAVHAVDLSTVDPERPWLLDPGAGDPRARLSDHHALARLVATETATWRAEPAAQGSWDPDRTAFGLRLDATLRRSAALAGDEGPDLLDPAQADAVRAWLVAAPADGGLPPYLRALHGRPDLTATFPRVPGADEAGFLAWARSHAAADGAPTELLEPALAAARPAPATGAAHGRPRPGVNVVGFLGAELGIGESARLLISALDARGIAHSTTSVDRFSQSRTTRDTGAASPTETFDTTVLCVNSDLTPTVAPAVADLMGRSYRIGMWYWEVEDFPATQHGGFDVLDEVWVATDFVRRAIEPHASIPVRTLTPPLPQRSGPPPLPRADLGLPDRPYLLFSFDFLSTAERKNPLGLVAAFSAAFAPDEGPLLVVKSINADKRPAQAEQLRLAAGSRPDILLLEDHLSPAARDALVAHCAGYVSLHRAEGLGLTMAEAMAWGKPVVGTRYSGNLQFMTDENSFLVAWHPTTVPSGAAPYPAGGTWADPDLDDAARLMRLIWDSPEVAAERGARAALDIAERHTAQVAGVAIAERLSELAGARRARSRRSLVTEGKAAAERAARRLLR